MNDKGEGAESGCKFQFLQPNRDLESNWEVNLAKKLEDYLLKICSGEISNDEDGNLSINFAEAALVIQGSIQVYSRKVEYLYSLVLHALEFISQKRQDQQENNPNEHNERESFAFGEENEEFLGLDEVPVEAKNCLDDESDEEDTANHFIKAAANMLVLEGDCLDSVGDAGELDSYLLATNDLYEDFLLLDPSDAGAVYDFVHGSSTVGRNAGVVGSSMRSKTHRSSMQSPARQSGGSAHKSGTGKRSEDNLKQTPGINIGFETAYNNIWSEPHRDDVSEGNVLYGRDFDNEYSETRDDSDDDEDDPWKPLNPHECGDLKVKPFKKGKIHKHRISSIRQSDITLQFPLAKLNGSICPEFAEMLKFRHRDLEKPLNSRSPPLYEKLRSSLVLGETRTGANFNGSEVSNEDMYENDLPDFEQDDVGFQDHMRMDEDLPLPCEKQNEDNFDSNEAYEPEEPCSQVRLEDLCRSHLDALLASIAETEKQTELAARVLTWKQGIEHAMEEQDSHPPFDIHEYGEQVLEKLSLGSDNSGIMSFVDVVCGQADYDVARTFSALLQLVNNRTVDIRKGESDGACVCYTAEHPFSLQLLSPGRRQGEVQMFSAKRRLKSPLKRSTLNKNAGEKVPTVSLLLSTSPGKSSKQPNGKLSVKLAKGNSIRCTPEAKRRRRSRVVQPG
ncbi:condensin-2 complex subunit H2 [Aristolochia californica]|uniref:condensin-2 complex subunit H2 n=1 Tax=Aristolochia californica TaxID=171875 RepID=UPI0035DA9C5D